MHHQKKGEKGKLTGSLVSAAMLAPAESSITELTLVLLLGSQRRLSHMLTMPQRAVRTCLRQAFCV